MRRSGLSTLSTQGRLYYLFPMQLPDAQHARPNPSETGFPSNDPSCRSLLSPVLETSAQRSAGEPDGHSQGGRMNAGWEVRPLGWVLLVILVGAMIYYLVVKRTRPTQDDPPTQ